MARPGEINGTIGRARELAAVINSLVIAPAVLVYVGAVASGWLPFRPLDNIAIMLQKHDEDMRIAVEDRKIATQLTLRLTERLALILDRVDRRDRLQTCAQITQPEIRHRCLEDR